MDTLPTTPGSIVTFDLVEEDGETIRGVATLIASHIDDDGTIRDAVWADSYIDSLDDTSNVFSEERILRSNPEVHTITAPATEVDDISVPGTVIRVQTEDGPVTYTYAPAFLYEGELQELLWSNSYGMCTGTPELTDYVVLYAPEPRA